MNHCKTQDQVEQFFHQSAPLDFFNNSQIQGIKGIGAKTAQRVILDLRDKILKVYDIDEVSISSNNTNKEEALSALEVLGFVRRQAEKVVDKVVSQEPALSVENIIKLALKNL